MGVASAGGPRTGCVPAPRESGAESAAWRQTGRRGGLGGIGMLGEHKRRIGTGGEAVRSCRGLTGFGGLLAGAKRESPEGAVLGSRPRTVGSVRMGCGVG